ncbi:outer membrane lipoprotein Blc [Alcanivorax sp. S71-1-4]|nr:outer membrane lipoprotein Blc [Alcanivorax sp. S71-1-4]
MIALLATLLPGCGGKPADMPVAEQVDLARYAGLWYEIARLPAFFQRGCYDATAFYSLNDDGTVAVTNRCLRQGESRRIEGTATAIDDTQARLKVQFDRWFTRLLPAGDYWIIHVDADYQRAVVGTPDRDYLWLLARTPEISSSDYRRMLDIAAGLDFPVDELVVNSDLRPQ